MMQARFEQHLQNRFPFLKGKKILLALSGGADSMVLAVLCKNAGLNVALAHCNFQLREKESDADQTFVENFADQTGIELFVDRFNTKKYASEHKRSIQVAARELRYEWFQKLAKEHGFQFIFTAHHADDTLETFLINAMRGTGLDGLTGIPEHNELVLRPLLVFSKDELLEFAKAEGISWREDSSNASENYLRNKIRLQVVPVLKSENPQLLESFMNTQQHLRDAADLLSEYTTLLFDEIVHEIDGNLHFDIQKVAAKANPSAVLYQLLKPYGFTAWDDIGNLLSSQTGKMVFSQTHRLLKNRDELILSKLISAKAKDRPIEITEDIWEVEFPAGKLAFAEVADYGKTGKDRIYVDKDSVKFPLKLRKWQERDYFYPFGMKGRKKVSKFFKDEKFSLIEKEETWLLLSENEIVWIIGQRADRRFGVESGTSKIMAVDFIMK